MALAGKGVLAIWNGIVPEVEAEFLAWHMREHIPERVSVPGFLRGRRYVALQGYPKYFNFYETETWETLTSPAYRERLNAPSPWTQKVVQHFLDTSRTMCSVAESRGNGDGAFIATFRLGASGAPGAFREAMAERIMEPALSQPSIIGVHLLEGQEAPEDGPTAEKVLRGQPDAVAEWILLVEAAESEALQSAMQQSLSPAALAGAGATYDVEKDSGIYRLQFALDRRQLQGEPALQSTGR